MTNIQRNRAKTAVEGSRGKKCFAPTVPLASAAVCRLPSAALSSTLCLLFALAASVDASEWRVLHAEPVRGARASLRSSTEESVTFNVQLLHENAALVLGCSVNFPLVIEDLTPLLRVKSDQPGIAIGAQIVLPRTIHPVSRRPVSYIVPGNRYSGSGNWETLGFVDSRGTPNLQSESKRIAALLQAEHKTAFDMRGQYVRQLVLLVERSPHHHDEIKQIEIGVPSLTGHVAADVGETERDLLFDPLNYVGFKVSVSSQRMYLRGNNTGTIEWHSIMQEHTAKPLVAAPDRINRPTTRTLPSGNDSTTFTLTSQQEQFTPSPASLTQIRFSNGILSLDDVPIGIRAIEYNDEPLELLRQLKFNAVWLKEQPSPEIRQEAQRVGIWLICPPPHGSELETARVYDPHAQPGRSTSALDSSYDNVLVWNISDNGSSPRYTDDAHRVQVLQTADRVKRRPILATARSGVYDYSRTVDILMLSREPLFSSLDMLDLHTWQKEYRSLARDDTPFWYTVQTQPSKRLTEQWEMFEGNPSFLSAVSYEQVKIQIYHALAAGARGILFTSHLSLSGNDPATEFRRTALELANLELQLVEEWFASGTPLPMLARSNRSSVTSAIIKANRSRLLVPLWQERHTQSAVGPAVVGNVRYIVSGIPETYGAYHLVPGRLMPLKSERVAGGVQIDLDEANLNSLIFFGEDDAMCAQVGERAKVIGARATYLACRIAELELSMTEQVLSALKRAKDTQAMPIHPKDKLPLIALQEYSSMLRTTREALDLAKSQANRTPPDYARAYLLAEQSTRGLRLTGRSLWQEATRHDWNLCMTPVSVSFATLPLYLTVHQRTHGGTLGTNRLPGGDMEMRTLEQAGWEPMGHKVEGVFAAKKEIVPLAKRSGQMGLRLVVAPETPSDIPKQLETVPLWVATPPMPVRMGEMICVSGWIRIPQPLISTVDGFMVFDSLGGEELALRFLHTSGNWREFVFYRNVPKDRDYHVFFALGGIGEVHLDDVRVSAVQFEAPQVQPSQPGQQPGPVPYWRRLNPFQYLPPMPTWGQ